MSWIQDHILLELTRSAVRRYSELRPQDVEGNLFMYHLKGLIKDGLVEKQDRHYTLTPKGLQLAGMLSLETGKARLQPKILTTIVCKNQADEYLFVRWHRQPNIGMVSFPHGMMHYGVSVADMAATELAEKSGLEASLAYRGEAYVRGMRGNEVDRHMLVHIFEAHDWYASRTDELRPEVSECFWARLDSLAPQEFVPGFYEIACLVDMSPAESYMFDDITVEVG
jgi:ADP-ribose pyrophosphatase YjhB (NUDIX family)